MRYKNLKSCEFMRTDLLLGDSYITDASKGMRSMTDTDREMISKMIHGDNGAFEEVYRRFHMNLYRTAYLISGNKADSEDILQETFVAVYLHRSELKSTEGFEKWAMKILVRKAIKITKRTRREASLDELLDDSEEGYGIERLSEDEKAISPQESIIKRETESELLRAVMRLPVKLRTAVALYYFKDYSIKETAAIMGVFEGTVKSGLHRARAVLKRELLRSGYTEENFERSGKNTRRLADGQNV